MGIRRELAEEKGGIEAVEEGVITGRAGVGEEKWRIVGVYIKEDIEKKLEGLKKWMEGNEEEETRIVTGGDFNARTGEMGGRIVIDKEENNQKSRNFKDKKVNREGRRLREALEESGWSILNGNVRGDEEGEYMYTGSRGNTVIDYIIRNEEVRERVVRLEVGEEVDSDHQPVICWIKGEGIEKRRKTGKRVRRGRWDEEGCERFRKKIGRIEMRKDEEVRTEIERMNGRIKEAMEESEKGEKEVGKSYWGWWDKECIEKKKEVRRELREWRKGKKTGEGFRKTKREY